MSLRRAAHPPATNGCHITAMFTPEVNTAVTGSCCGQRSGPSGAGTAGRSRAEQQAQQWRSLRRSRRAFTLIEALVASAVLLLTVLATSMALWSGQRQGAFSQDAVQGALAAAALMEEILAVEYAAMSSYDGQIEPVGELVTSTGRAYPATYYRIGRSVTVESMTHEFGELRVRIDGLQITVRTFDVAGTELSTLSRFVPEPNQS
ncbi:MAG: type IV pilus modification PilV family protein [Planctomycetota bacterium]